MQRLLAMTLGVCLFSGLGLAASLAAEGRSPADDTATQDTLSVAFVDEHGAAQAAPYFAVGDAYPGMAPRTAVVTLHNSGTLDVGYDVSVVTAEERGGPHLADVLQVTVTADDTGRMVYRGPLSNVRFEGTQVLDAGASAGYAVAIDWPDGGAGDNAFQGRRLAFELRARARHAP